MRKLLIALVALLFSTPAWAFGDGEKVIGVWGDYLTFSATNHALAPGFEADWVEICVLPGTGNNVYVRQGRTLALATSTDTGAVTATIFQDGAAGNVEGQALVFSQNSTATEPNCSLLPWRVDGLVFHIANPGAAAGASLDVRFYQTRFDRR